VGRPMTARQGSSCALARPPRPPSLVTRHRPALRAMLGALAACRFRCPRASRGACARRCSRPNAAPARRGKRLRHAWPDTLLVLRGASPGADPEVRQWSAAPPARRAGTGLPSNAGCKERARAVVEPTPQASARRGQKVTRFHATHSQAAPWREPGRGRCTRRPPPLGGHRSGARPPPGARAAPRLCPRPSGTRAQGSPTVPASGAPGLSARRSPAVARIAACGRLRVTRDVTSRWLADNAVGLRDAGDEPGARTPTRCPGASGPRSVPASCPVAPGGRRRVPWLACVRLSAPTLGVPARAARAPGPRARCQPKRAVRLPGARWPPCAPSGQRQDRLLGLLEAPNAPGMRLL
jgi:hypothetical protein